MRPRYAIYSFDTVSLETKCGRLPASRRRVPANSVPAAQRKVAVQRLRWRLRCGRTAFPGIAPHPSPEVIDATTPPSAQRDVTATNPIPCPHGADHAGHHHRSGPGGRPRTAGDRGRTAVPGQARDRLLHRELLHARRRPSTTTPAPAGRARSATRSGCGSTSAPPRPSPRSSCSGRTRTARRSRSRPRPTATPGRASTAPPPAPAARRRSTSTAPAGTCGCTAPRGHRLRLLAVGVPGLRVQRRHDAPGQRNPGPDDRLARGHERAAGHRRLQRSQPERVRDPARSPTRRRADRTRASC